jgi:hypothetical protein
MGIAITAGTNFKNVWRGAKVSPCQTVFVLPSGCVLRRMNPVTACLLVGLTCGVATPCRADPVSAEPTKLDCDTAVEQARTLAAALPADDLSRYFAERDLHQAMVEAGNGEFDDCLELAARATEEIKERRHALPPGEKLKVLRPDE